MTTSSTTITIEDLLTRWRNARTFDWSPSTQRTCASLSRRIVAHLGSVPIHDLGAADLDAFYCRLRTGIGPDGAAVQALQPSTTLRYHGVLQAALGQAVRWDLLDRNPADRATPPKVRPAIHPPTTTEVTRALRHCTQHHPELALFLRLAVITGARRGELCALRWSSLNPETNTLTIDRTVVIGPNSERVVRGPKNGRTRVVAIDPTTIAHIERHRTRQAITAVRSRHRVVLDRDPFLFGARRAGDRPLNPGTFTSRWLKVRGEVDLRHVRLHDLRHYAVSSMLAGGIPVRTVADRVGHASAAMTLNVYGHALPSQDREAAALLAALFGEP